jgi:hypothetical protein
MSDKPEPAGFTPIEEGHAARARRKQRAIDEAMQTDEIISGVKIRTLDERGLNKFELMRLALDRRTELDPHMRLIVRDRLLGKLLAEIRLEARMLGLADEELSQALIELWLHADPSRGSEPEPSAAR